MISVESIDYSDDDDDDDDEFSPPPPLPTSMNNENAQSIDSLMADLGNMVKTPRPDNNQMVIYLYPHFILDNNSGFTYIVKRW
jgi:hypothetical protein